MSGNEYQMKAMLTAAPGSINLTVAALGLAGEAGEFADAVKKHVAQQHDLDHDELVKETSDILWYCALACQALGVKMSDVMQQNLDKLAKRYQTGRFTADESRNREEYRGSAATAVKDGEELVDAILAGESLFGSAESAQPCTVVKIDDTVHRIPAYREPVGAVVDFSKMNGADDMAYYGGLPIRGDVTDVSQYLASISDNDDPIIRTHSKMDFTTGKWVRLHRHLSGGITEEQVAPEVGDEYEYYDPDADKIYKFRFDAVGKKAGAYPTWRMVGTN